MTGNVISELHTAGSEVGWRVTPDAAHSNMDHVPILAVLIFLLLETLSVNLISTSKTYNQLNSEGEGEADTIKRIFKRQVEDFGPANNTGGNERPSNSGRPRRQNQGCNPGGKIHSLPPTEGSEATLVQQPDPDSPGADSRATHKCKGRARGGRSNGRRRGTGRPRSTTTTTTESTVEN